MPAVTSARTYAESIADQNITRPSSPPRRGRPFPARRDPVYAYVLC
ncbi:hypothetical protein [Streptomyces sp. NPDC006195]